MARPPASRAWPRRSAARQLAGVLAKRGDLDQLRARADAGDGDAAEQLVRLLAERGDLGELRAWADANWRTATPDPPNPAAVRGDRPVGDRSRA